MWNRRRFFFWFLNKIKDLVFIAFDWVFFFVKEQWNYHKIYGAQKRFGFSNTTITTRYIQYGSSCFKITKKKNTYIYIYIANSTNFQNKYRCWFVVPFVKDNIIGRVDLWIMYYIHNVWELKLSIGLWSEMMNFHLNVKIFMEL